MSCLGRSMKFTVAAGVEQVVSEGVWCSWLLPPHSEDPHLGLFFQHALTPCSHFIGLQLHFTSTFTVCSVYYICLRLFQLFWFCPAPSLHFFTNHWWALHSTGVPSGIPSPLFSASAPAPPSGILCPHLQSLCYHATPVLLCTTQFFAGHKYIIIHRITTCYYYL